MNSTDFEAFNSNKWVKELLAEVINPFVENLTKTKEGTLLDKRTKKEFAITDKGYLIEI